MTERSLGLGWIETLSPPQTNQFIFIRHGESEYTEMGMDLTQVGVSQAQDTARALRRYLQHFDKLKVVASPAPRAQSTAAFFVQESGISPDEFSTERLIRYVDIKDLKGFMDYQAEHSTGRYGEMWLTDKFLAKNNKLTEGRESVENRAREFLLRYSKLVNAQGAGVKTGVLVFTHFEIIMTYLKSIYPNNEFPIRSQNGVQNAEPVIMQIDDVNKKRYTIISRGMSSIARI